MRDSETPRARATRSASRPPVAEPTVNPFSVLEDLAAKAGNHAFTRALAGRHPLLRQAAPTTQTPAPTTPTQPDQGADGAQAQPAAQLSPEATKKLIYAQTVLAKVGQLPEAERASLKKMVEGSDVMALIERRDKLRTDLEQARTDLQSTKDISGPERADAEKKAQNRVDNLGLDLEGVQTEIDQNLKKLGVASEAELVELVTKRFPDLWKKRAKDIAGKMLDENLAAVDKESARYDYFAGGAPKTAYDDIGALRLADREIAAANVALIGLEYPLGGAAIPATTLAGLQAQLDAGPPQPPAALGEEEAKRLQEVHQRKVALLNKWQSLGAKHVILLHPSYKPGYLDESGDEHLLKMSGAWIEETRDNIKKTRENIESEKVSLWTLRDVPDLAFDSLGVPRDSVLGKAVAKDFEGKKEDEEARRAAMDALAIGATLVGFMAGGPLGAMVAGAAVGGAVTVAQLAEDYSKFQAQSAAQGTALDPELAKMSTDEPDLFAVVMDVVALGVAVADAVTAAKGLRGALRALKAGGDKEAFVTEAKKHLGDEWKARALADKVAVERRAFPEGFMEVFDDYRAAHNAYMEALKADATKEVGIWRNKKTGKYVLGYGEPARVQGPIVSGEQLWELVKHHHPGSPIVATLTDRVPSTEDFENMMAPRHAAVDPAPVKSTISWVDKEGVVHYTTFGMDPTEIDRYWVRYTDLHGQVVERRFRYEPWKQDKIEYENWIDSLKRAEQAEIHGAPTAR